MKTKTLSAEFKTFAYLIPFFIVVAIIYGYFTNPMEWVGVVGLALTACLCAFIAGFILLVARKIDDRPEDNELGEISDAATDNYGFFSPHSWWPLWLALSGALLFLGVAVGWWLVIIASPFAAWATVGWVFEYFRGEKAV